MADDKEPVIIGIIGDDPFNNAFDPIRNKQAKGRRVVINLTPQAFISKIAQL